MTSEINFDIYQNLHEVSRNMHHLAHYIGDEQGVKQDLGRSLNFIYENKETSVKQLADYYRIKPSSATVKVNKLVEQGFIIKVQDEKDLRSFQLKLTSLGEKERQQINENTNELIEGIFDDLSPNQKSVFLDELKLINQRLIEKTTKV